MLEDTVPPQLQLVWDNLNLRSKHKFERQKDNYYDSNFDWMASLWILERISANHMKHVPGQALKEHISLSIQDFIPSEDEKNYVFTSLVHYYTSRLVCRHPEVFKSINSSIQVRFVYQNSMKAILNQSQFLTGWLVEADRVD